MIIKNFPDAFNKTDLERILHENKCNALFLRGLSSVGFALATYFGAKNADLNIFMIRDTDISHNSAYTDNIGEILKGLDFDTIALMLKNAET